MVLTWAGIYAPRPASTATAVAGVVALVNWVPISVSKSNTFLKRASVESPSTAGSTAFEPIYTSGASMDKYSVESRFIVVLSKEIEFNEFRNILSCLACKTILPLSKTIWLFWNLLRSNGGVSLKVFCLEIDFSIGIIWLVVIYME